jgi:monothiol glutaredoxin
MGLLARLGRKLKILGQDKPEPRDLSASMPRQSDPEDEEPKSPRAPGETARAFIERTVHAHPVVLFMKGTPDAPQCGFSASAVGILRSAGVAPFTVNVLSDDDVRDDVKSYSSWPTIPQIYIGGEFVGGSDILGQIAQSGELGAMLAKVKT